jgi:hypothetical protein
VELPVMASAQKMTYKSRSDSTLTDSVEYTPDEIIGEYKEKGQAYYYARYKGGIAHKVTLAPRDALFSILTRPVPSLKCKRSRRTILTSFLNTVRAHRSAVACH